MPNVKIINLSTINKMDNNLDAHFYVNIPDDILRLVENISDEEIKNDYINKYEKVDSVFKLFSRKEIMGGLDENVKNLFLNNIDIFENVGKVPNRINYSKLLAFLEYFRKDFVINEKIKELDQLKYVLNNL